MSLEILYVNSEQGANYRYTQSKCENFVNKYIATRREVPSRCDFAGN